MHLPEILNKVINSLPHLINISITASYIILIILLVRIVFRKTPKKLICAMWGIAAIRLICPISFRSRLSLIPAEETIPTEMFIREGTALHTPAVIDVISNPVYPQNVSVELNSTVGYFCDKVTFFTVIWIIGLLLLLLYAAISTLLLKKKVSTATLLAPGIKQTEMIDAPFLLGIIRPTVYLPYSLQSQDLEYVIAHEKAHIRRKDHLWKPLGFLILSVYWFNPMIWVAYVFLCRDIEAACDEKVIGEMQEEDRRGYSESLLRCSTKRPIISACPVAFGEESVKERIKNVMNYKKPAFWIICIALILCLVLTICFLTNPKNPDTGADAEWAAQFKDSAEDAIDKTCMKYLFDDNRPRVYWTASHKTLALRKGEQDQTLEAYLWVVYEEYITKQEGGFTVASQNYGVSTPAIIVFSTNETTHAVDSVLEFWVPRNGSYYTADLKERFPKDLRKKLKSDEEYAADLKIENLKKINEFFDVCSNLLMPCDSDASDLEEFQNYENGKFVPYVHFKAPKNSPVYASASGKVIQAGYEGPFGNSIIIQSSDSVEIKYFHLNQMHVEVGDYVFRGDTIGTVGITGVAVEPTLGFGIQKNHENVDPRIYLKKNQTISEDSYFAPNYNNTSTLHAKEFLQNLKENGYYQDGIFEHTFNTEHIQNIVNITPQSISDEINDLEIFLVDGTYCFLTVNNTICRYDTFGGYHHQLCLWDYDNNGTKDLVSYDSFGSGISYLMLNIFDITKKENINVITRELLTEPSFTFSCVSGKILIDGRELVYRDGKFSFDSGITLLPQNYKNVEIRTIEKDNSEVQLSPEKSAQLIQVLKNKKAENLGLPAFNDANHYDANILISFTDENNVQIYSLGLCIGENGTKKCYAVSRFWDMNYAEIQNSEEFYELIMWILQ